MVSPSTHKQLDSPLKQNSKRVDNFKEEKGNYPLTCYIVEVAEQVPELLGQHVIDMPLHLTHFQKHPPSHLAAINTQPLVPP